VKLKAKETRIAETERKMESKAPRGSEVAFPWKWVGVGFVVFIVVLAVIVIKPGFPSGSSNPPGTNPDLCTEGKNILVSFTFTLHILITDHVGSTRNNYTQPIPNDIGKEPLPDGTPCTRRMYSYTAPPSDPFTGPATIHLDSPEDRSYYLEDWFVIWNQGLNSTPGHMRVLTYAQPDWNVTLKVDGLPFNGRFENIQLKAETPVQSFLFYVYRY